MQRTKVGIWTGDNGNGHHTIENVEQNENRIMSDQEKFGLEG